MSDKDKIIDELLSEKEKLKYDENYVSKQFTLDDIINEYSKNHESGSRVKMPSYAEKREDAPVLTKERPKSIFEEDSFKPKTVKPENTEALHAEKPLKKPETLHIAEESVIKSAEKEPVQKPEAEKPEVKAPEKTVSTPVMQNINNSKTQELKIKPFKKKYFATDTIDFMKSSTAQIDTVIKKAPSKSIFEEGDDDEPAIEEKNLVIEPEIEDYNEARDVDSIKRDLISQKRGLFFKSFFSALISLLLLYIGSAGAFGLYQPAVINPAKNMFTFGFANSALTFLLIIVCFNTITDGISSFFRLKFSNDTLCTVAVIVTLIHSIMTAFTGKGSPMLYNGAAALAMFFSMLGKYFFVSNVGANFKVITKDNEKLACETANKLYSLKNLYKEEGDICVTRPVKIVGGFLENSFSNDPTERISSKVGIISLVIIILTAVLSGVMKGRGYIMPSLAAVSAVSASFMAELAFALPFFLISKKVRKLGGTLIGYNAAECFKDAETLMLKDTDLFPKDKANIYSMKIIDKSRIDEVMLNAASLVSFTGGPLSDAFLRLLDKREGMLKELKEFCYYEGKGISGIIDGKRYLAGSADFLSSNGIDMPKEDYEVKYGRGGKSVLMFGGEGKVLAVFIVGYGISDEFAKVIKRLDSSDFTLGVITRDHNITESLIEAKYDLTKTPVIIPSRNETEVLEESMRPAEKLNAHIVSSGGAAGICAALEACGRAKSAVNACAWLRTAGMITGGLLILLLSISSGQPVEAVKIVLFQLLWMIPFVFTLIFKAR